MSNLRNYKTGGILHVIANNQIGFTTTPKDGRSTPFCTDIGKGYDSPIIHVNADNPIAVDFAFTLAAEFSRKFPKDIIVDIIGYRRHGHNELDQPKFTQPEMYSRIEKRKDVLQLFEERLVSEGIDPTLLRNIKEKVKANLEQYYKEAMLITEKEKDPVPIQWVGFSSDIYSPPNTTGYPVKFLQEIGKQITTIPKEFNAHPTIRKIYENRYNTIQEGKNIDWATAEALAFACLLKEGEVVRLSGQDVERGTFSHRHSVVHDQVTGEKYIPMNSILENKGNFQVCLSHLSEFAVLGFEYGFSTYSPRSLCLWEAQFGDFANGAQIIIDQFITSGEAKWGQESGLVMLLPHGYDGQGAEHSCARLGRFLQASSEDPYTIPYDSIKDFKQCFFNNIQVANPTTPANYFHFLRRQIKRGFRKPLIVMSPKRLLRHKLAVSDLSELSEDRVKRVIDDSLFDLFSAKSVRKVILCSGQIYYDLFEERAKRGINEIAIVRIEQLAPFPFEKIQELGKKYSTAEFQWVQEEPLNLGAWQYVEPRILTSFGNQKEVSVVSRYSSASTATGYHSVHQAELLHLLEKSMS